VPEFFGAAGCRPSFWVIALVWGGGDFAMPPTAEGPVMLPLQNRSLMSDPAKAPFIRPSAPRGSDRRVAKRHTCLATHQRLVAAIGDDFCLAKIRNISPEGVSLIVSRPVESGTVLSVDLIDTKTNRFSRTLEVRVIYAVEHPTGDWILGGTFSSKLTPEELQQFLAAPQ